MAVILLLAVKTLEVLKAVDGLLLLAAKMKPKDEMIAGLLAFMPWTSPRLVQRSSYSKGTWQQFCLNQFYIGFELFTVWKFIADLNMMVWKRYFFSNLFLLGIYVQLQGCKFKL